MALDPLAANLLRLTLGARPRRAVNPTPSRFVLAKADRLLRTGAVCVRCEEDGIRATVDDHDQYVLHRSRDGSWRCPCPARIRNCSHVAAVSAVTGWSG